MPMIKEAAIRHNGTVFTGHRHHNIFHANSVRQNGIIISSIASGEQGFTTDTGEFLNRSQAAEHAIACGQVQTGKAVVQHVFDGRTLYSEDLY